MSIFGFIGVTVIIFLWTAKGFGAPPLFFKIVGSFIALGFIAMGFGMPITAILKGKSQTHTETKPSLPGKGGGYDCPNCGANIMDGDVKCPYCQGWWNIHHS